MGDRTPTEGSEDCLYLNVFAPVGTQLGSRLPVMVHLHGGANWFGNAYTNADAFTDRGVIVVTVGYRLGAFGFMGLPALSAEAGGSSGEYGVLDQIAALHWVRNNIANFGGDASNVTLFGESAGSFDAVAIAVSPLGQGLMTRLAAQTESFWAGRGIGHIADSEQIGDQVAGAVGCSGEVDVAACMRGLPADALVLAAGANDVAPPVGGVVLPEAPLALIADDPAPVPMLLGSNREEARAFFGSNSFDSVPYGESDWIRDSNLAVGPQHGAVARDLYPVKSYGSFLWAGVGLATDTLYTCPMRQLALSSHGTVYRYLFTHRYDNDPGLAALRAAHFLDDPLLWHDGNPLGGYTFSQGEDLLAARMADYWTNFAKAGDPNGPGLPVWPQYSASSERTTVLDAAPGELSNYHVTECRFLDSLPTTQDFPAAYTPAWPRPLRRFG